MGKVSLILAMEGRPGHYGLKDTAEDLVPNQELPLYNIMGCRKMTNKRVTIVIPAYNEEKYRENN